MKKILILSGKGGTGKTTVASAFIDIGSVNIYADCDVDAPNLHLVMEQNTSPNKSNFYGLGTAVIDLRKCIHCKLCEQNCSFGAIKDEYVNIYECEGCGVCERVCPTNAIKLKNFPAGEVLLYKSKSHTFSTAKLKMGSGTSGKLVTAVKKQLPDNLSDEEIVIIDGSPGIGCPVIASISGVDMVLIVTEPTISGIHDLKRIIKTAQSFDVKCLVCINKYNINNDNSKEIEDYCANINIPVLGKIPFDDNVIKAVNGFKSIAKYPNSPAAKAINKIWNKLISIV